MANSGKEICSTCIHPVHAKKLREQNFIAHTPAVQLHSHHGRHKLEIAAVNFEADRDADDGETQRRNDNTQQRELLLAPHHGAADLLPDVPRLVRCPCRTHTG